MKYQVREREVVAFGGWPETAKEALSESIRKWEWLAKWIEGHPRQRPPSTRSRSCSLCKLYLHSEEADYSCVGCPVYKKSRQHECRGTPYVWYMDSIQEESASLAHTLAHASAIAEVDFLKQLKV